MDAINAEVIGPSGPVYLDFDLGPDGGRGYFQPDEIGMHELFVTNEGEAVKGSPHYLRSMPKSKKDYDGKLQKDFLKFYLAQHISWTLAQPLM